MHARPRLAVSGRRVLVVGVTLLALAATSSATAASGPARVSGANQGFALSTDPLFDSKATVQRLLDEVVKTGARWVRFDCYWAALEPAPGQYSWDRLDWVVDAARARHLSILGTIAYTPDWARRRGTTDHAPPTKTTDYATFAAAIATRYAGRVNAWEIWNEPNTSGFWQPRPDPAAYRALLASASAAIHSVEPQATVLNGGLAPAGARLDYTARDGSAMSPWRFLTDLYADGAAGTFDALADHPYAPQPALPDATATGNAFHDVSQLHDLMAANGDGAKAIWATEVGATTGGTAALSRAQQATAVTQYLTGWSALPFAGPLFYFELRDRGTNHQSREDNFGLLDRKWHPKPAYRTYVGLVAG
jgi:hypothetical protein